MNHNIVNNPSHYTAGRSIEPVDAIEDWQLNWHIGNAVKYLSRAGRKDYAGGTDLSTIADLDKAVWYIMRHRNRLARMANLAIVNTIDDPNKEGTP